MLRVECLRFGEPMSDNKHIRTGNSDVLSSLVHAQTGLICYVIEHRTDEPGGKIRPGSTCIGDPSAKSNGPREVFIIKHHVAKQLINTSASKVSSPISPRAAM